MAILAAGLTRGLCRVDAFGGDPQDVGKQSVWSESSGRGQARRIASCGVDALSTLRSEDDGLLHRPESRYSALRMLSWSARQWRAAMYLVCRLLLEKKNGIMSTQRA